MRQGVAFHILFGGLPVCAAQLTDYYQCGHTSRANAEATAASLVSRYVGATIKVTPGPCPNDDGAPLRLPKPSAFELRKQLRSEHLPPEIRDLFETCLRDLRRRDEQKAAKRRRAARSRTGRRA